MSNNDQRQDIRVGVSINNQYNDFFLHCGDQTFEISKIRDVSISGVGVETVQACEKGDTVVLKFDSDDLKLNIRGSVMWCKPLERDGYALGIEFDVQNREDNTLFFMAMRKYLDDFDSLPYNEAM